MRYLLYTPSHRGAINRKDRNIIIRLPILPTHLADVLTALALGASAVCVGRPYVYGLAIDGEAGVEAVLSRIIAEFDIALGLSGHTSVAQLGRDALVKG